MERGFGEGDFLFVVEKERRLLGLLVVALWLVKGLGMVMDEVVFFDSGFLKEKRGIVLLRRRNRLFFLCRRLSEIFEHPPCSICVPLFCRGETKRESLKTSELMLILH